MYGHYLSYLNLEKIYSPPGGLLGLGLGTLSTLVHYRGHSVHGVGGPALPRHAAGTGWLVPAQERPIKHFILGGQISYLAILTAQIGIFSVSSQLPCVQDRESSPNSS